MKKFVFILIGIILGIYLLTGIYVVGSEKMGVVTFFGRVVADRIPAGIHYAFPWPFTKVYTPAVAVVKRMSIGFKLVDQLQGIGPSRNESERLSGDSNVITVSIMVQYTVRDPGAYLFNAEDPDFLVRKAGEALLCEKVGMISVDDLLTVGKSEVEQYVRNGLQTFSDSVGAGLRIRSCSLQKVEPPLEVIESFNEVSRAKSNREKIINDAHTYRSEMLPKARAQAQQIVQSAQAVSAARVSKAEGDAARFEKIFSEYRKNPKILSQRLYWDTIEAVLAGARKIIVDDKPDDQGTNLHIISDTP
ncbi:FtsH protease activity modulator HflK [candidate division LCP-89 bacterium B3_LCP]|uniref:Protein HflK n=1 Tax=candidate division LCP-89 bacterium B3_LCP TaxID=2012998 RepID=A0A532V3D2_UNCL8|nr:MAG: FtsH protease activity modulator HflK [candidate division LCP-89 bacterium B3_LCP]